jgi:Arc/MetJ family transcription regulator
MQIRIPDELAAEAFRLLAQPDHKTLTPFVHALLRREVSAHKTRAESRRRALRTGHALLQAEEGEKGGFDEDHDDSEARAGGLR